MIVVITEILFTHKMNSDIIHHFKKLLEHVRIKHVQYIYKQIIIVCNKALNTINCKNRVPKAMKQQLLMV